MRKIDLLGQRFGHWLVIGRAEYSNGKPYWICRCDCGTTKTIRGSSLKCGDSVSCGCFAERLKYKYKGTGTGIDSPEYGSWSGMIQRCTNKNAPGYKNYGGRGISICQEWINSFLQFYHSVGPRPSPNHSLDRVNNDGNYEPGNVRWATRKEQNRNTRRTLLGHECPICKEWHTPRS